ncbi:hypothetical protein KGF86_07465 [Ornithinibacillus massiliensis]|uniref:Magnesium transporter MgtE intracellular domain-containing protein n=1 Tax=Ornithinibacillus massiliensis TaxID=1944633 RepID=A0ABS5MCJ3_9BACI|nr:hypothetical protein [Ornithinibacillus massiliensis]MBS3680048.1 hypothetical protein [Ornithinibacillus massiliensis]
MAEQKVVKEKEKMNPILWFLFAIVIPVIIAITLTAIVLSLAGVNVIDWAKNTGSNIPVVSSLIPTDDEVAEKKEEENYQATIAAKDEKIEQLNQEKTALESSIEQLELTITKLQRDLEAAKQTTEEDSSKSIKQMSSSFKEMSSEQAAIILEQLDQESAFTILSEMSNKDRGAILGNMTPESAAAITKLFINQ